MKPQLKTAILVVLTLLVTTFISILSNHITFPIDNKWQPIIGVIILLLALVAGIIYLWQSTHEQATQIHVEGKHSDEGNGPATRALSSSNSDTNGKKTLLHFFVDRTEQEFMLRNAIRENNQRQPKRPFVCIVHGDQQQCHDTFFTYIEKEILKYVVPQDNGNKNIQVRRIQAHDFSCFSVRLLDALLKGLYPDPKEPVYNESLSVETINRHIETFFTSTPVLVEMNVYDADGTDIISHYLRFWNDWPDLTDGTYLLVFLFVHYPVDQPKRMQRLFRLRRYETLNGNSKEFVCQIDQKPDFEHCTVIPELQSISLADALDWADSHDVRTFCNGDDIKDDVRRIYKQQPKSAKGIPLKKLAADLQPILDKYASNTGDY